MDEENETTIETQSAANGKMLQLIRTKWKEQISQATFHLHSFLSLANNKDSNAFMQRVSKPAKDSFVQFAIKARTNTLPTQEFIEIIKGQQHTGCPKCNAQTDNSLQNILKDGWWNNRRAQNEDPDSTSESEDNSIDYDGDREEDHQQAPTQHEVDIEENERWAASQEMTLSESEDEEESERTQRDNRDLPTEESIRRREEDAEEEEEIPERFLGLLR